MRTCDFNHDLEHLVLGINSISTCFVWMCAEAPMTGKLTIFDGPLHCDLQGMFAHLHVGIVVPFVC